MQDEEVLFSSGGLVISRQGIEFSGQFVEKRRVGSVFVYRGLSKTFLWFLVGGFALMLVGFGLKVSVGQAFGAGVVGVSLFLILLGVLLLLLRKPYYWVFIGVDLPGDYLQTMRGPSTSLDQDVKKLLLSRHHKVILRTKDPELAQSAARAVHKMVMGK